MLVQCLKHFALVAAMAVAQGGWACEHTPAQVSGPHHKELFSDKVALCEAPKDVSQRLIIEGVALGSKCLPMANVQIQLWHVSPSGSYGQRESSDCLIGAQKVRTDAKGRFRFVTVWPGLYEPAPGWIRPRHFHLAVTKKKKIVFTTQIYLETGQRLESDPIYKSSPESERHKLVAVPEEVPQAKKVRVKLVIESPL